MLGQACAHCPKFLTAASRRSLGRLSVPVWLAVLSDQLSIAALVGHYPTSQLIDRGPLPEPLKFSHGTESTTSAVLATLSGSYPPLEGRSPTCYSAVRHYPHPEGREPFDLHVLGTPPAFILSQDQTLHRNCRSHSPLTGQMASTISQQIVTLPTTLRLSTFPRHPRSGSFAITRGRKDIVPTPPPPCQGPFRPSAEIPGPSVGP